MWDLPGSGIEPMSLAFAHGFFTPKLPGKPVTWETLLTKRIREKSILKNFLSLFFELVYTSPTFSVNLPNPILDISWL